MNRAKFWSLFAAFMIGYTVLIGIVQEADEEAARVEAYANGVAYGVDQEAKLNEKRAARNALQWWVGSDQLDDIRDRLCYNYRKGEK